MEEKKWQWKKVHIAALLIFLYAGCLTVLSFIGYSDGDDTFFLEYCGNMGFFEYLGWRYETWTGRMASEALMHIFFNMDLWVWRIVNAGMIAALPVGLNALKNRVVRTNGETALQSESDRNRSLFIGIGMAVWVYLLLDIKAFGYSAIWVTGSMNYLWPVVCGIVALYVVAESAFGETVVSRAEKKGTGSSYIPVYIIASVCAVTATMSSEQMGAVLLAFELICIAEQIWKKKPVGTGIVILTAVTAGVFAISSLSPGNDLRIVAAIEYNMPQFEALTIGERGFLLIQWLVSSFANENAVFLMALWLIGGLLLWSELKCGSMTGKERQKKCYLAGSIIFFIVAVAGKCGMRRLNDIGINLAELTGCVERVPQAADMTAVQWGVLVWWILALIFTFFFLWKVSKGSCLILLIYLGAVASEVIMIFSPTIYSSGERVFFLAGLMLWFIAMVLYETLPKGKMRVMYVSALICIGLGNLVLQLPELMTML